MVRNSNPAAAATPTTTRGTTLTLSGSWGASFLAAKSGQKLTLKVSAAAYLNEEPESWNGRPIKDIRLDQKPYWHVERARIGVLEVLAQEAAHLLRIAVDVGQRPGDPATYAGASVVFLLIALAVIAIPAMRAARLEPVMALRDE